MSKKFNINILIFIFIVFFIFSSILLIKNLNNPEMVIKNHIKYKNAHNIEELSSTITNPLSTNYIEYLDNIESTNLINLKLNTDEKLYNIYINSGKGSLRKNLSRDTVKIYTVNYYIKYKDDTKSIEGTGEHSHNYILIKENGKWLIDDIGD